VIFLQTREKTSRLSYQSDAKDVPSAKNASCFCKKSHQCGFGENIDQAEFARCGAEIGGEKTIIAGK